MNTNTASNDKRPQNDPRAESLGESLVGLGTAWARYGLRLGSVALENQSRHLEACGKALGEALAHTAKALSGIADGIAQKDQGAEKTAGPKAAVSEPEIIDMPTDAPAR